jgi:hypothetical protein
VAVVIVGVIIKVFAGNGGAIEQIWGKIKDILGLSNPSEIQLTKP